MKKNIRKLIIILLIIIFLGSGIYLAVHTWQQRQALKDYEAARELAGLTRPIATAAPTPDAVPDPTPEQSGGDAAASAPSAEPAPEPESGSAANMYVQSLSSLSLEALREVDPNVVGWVDIPDTMLSYPVMQGKDNDYYLYHSWNGESNGVGAIFMDYRNSADFSDFNTILYGHRMGNGTMFHSLHDYKEEGHWEKFPSVFIVTDEGLREYEIFAAYEADAVKKHTYRLGLEETEDQQAYIDYCLEQSDIDTGVVPVPGDNILTLSTCIRAGGFFETRWVVQAVYHVDGDEEAQ